MMMIIMTNIFNACSSVKEEYVHVFDNDDMARTLWTDDTVTDYLNEYQQKAIRQALTNNFQLIQGPPGLRTTQ